MERNFIEQVTNLEREKEKYVPKRLFDHLISDYQAEHSFEGLEEDAEFDNKIFTMIEQAEKESRELFVLEEPEKKNDLETCLYCGGWMTPEFTDNGYRSSYRGYSSFGKRINGDLIHFRCAYCGATSPTTVLRTNLLNNEAVKKDILRNIETAKREVKEEEGNYEE